MKPFIILADTSQGGLSLLARKEAIFFAIVLFLIVAFAVVAGLLAWRKRNAIGEVAKNKLAQTQIIVYAGFAIIFLLFISGVIVQSINATDNFLMNLSVTVIISWIVLLICYYAWALYFYNINMGWSDDKWSRFRQQQEDPTTSGKSPNANPHSEETLGLPPGTVRGTIALSLLVGALALTIASFSMDSSIKNSVILIDNFDFYKKAFLMMIAFYFGTKSLEILQNSPSGTARQNTVQEQQEQKNVEQNAVNANVNTGVRLETFQQDFVDPDAKG